MFGAVGMKVVELERISMGKLTLPANLKRGEYLELKLEDIVGVKLKKTSISHKKLHFFA